jgi:hypothetical protein
VQVTASELFRKGQTCLTSRRSMRRIIVNSISVSLVWTLRS